MKKVTYAQIDKVLSSLGFSMRVATVDNKLPNHMAAVQGTLKVHGIADPLDLAVELQKAS
jgi:hypothetical protein